MINKKFMSKSVKFLMLTSLLGSLSVGLFAPNSTQAAELNPEVAQLLGDSIEQDSAITYVINGVKQVLPVPVGQAIQLRGHASSIDITINRKKTTLRNVTDLTIKGITVSNLIPFYTRSVTNLTLDGVNFQKGMDISGASGLTSILVKDSTFGATDYSLAVHGASSLTSYVIDNSNFNADVRIYSNKSLETTTISNSVLKDRVTQYSNKRGYNTDFLNNRFEYFKKRSIASGGMSTNDIFHINPGDLSQIGATRFDDRQAGKIIYKLADGTPQTFDVAAGVKVTYVEDSGNRITIKLSNGQSTVLTDAKSLTFYNVDLTRYLAFTSASLKLEKLEFINSRTRLIDVAYSKTLESFKINRSEVSQSTGYVSVYNNKAIKEFVMQESVVTGSSGYISVYNIPTLTDFVMTNTYTHGYLSAYNLGASVLELSNAKYDDYINTNQLIEGEAGRVVIGDAPELEHYNKDSHPFGIFFDINDYVRATDTEDGYVDVYVLDSGGFDVYTPGSYDMIVAATDADDNTVELAVTIVVQ